MTGQTAYVEEEWGAMVVAMEESLRLYLKSVKHPKKSIILRPLKKALHLFEVCQREASILALWRKALSSVAGRRTIADCSVTNHLTKSG